ncbi:hypothetical protein WBG78_01330 [Chryseolinea sp. T2]|uniref:hypothetical protein n=1 Tax=Chryseolinea sp. T2 TaxID=3129255 RepID=UPI00307790DE
MYWLRNKDTGRYRKGYPLSGIARFFSLCLVLLLTMCTPPSKKGQGMFAVDSLLHAQANQLTRMHATLDKQVVLGGSTEEISTVPNDTVTWLRELEIFTVMESINKPVNREQYKIEESKDKRSNLRIRSISTAADLPVPYVNLYYYEKPSKIRKIEAAYSETNGLYRTSRLLSMEFDNVNGLPVMTSYSISGGQKMFMDDTVRYDIKGRVTIGN